MFKRGDLDNNMETTTYTSVYPITSKEKRIFSFLAVIMMFGNVYTFPLLRMLGWGEVLFLLFIPYFLAKSAKMITISKAHLGFIVFMLYCFIGSLIASSLLQASLISLFTRLARDFFYYFIALFLGTKLYDKKTFFHWINVFCICLSVYVMAQSIVYTITGYFIPGFLLNAQINDGGYVGRELYSKYLAYARISGYLRPNGFLCEPSHCAQCFFVGLVVLLFGEDEQDRKHIWTAVLFSIGALLTMSTSAVVYVGVTWSFWLLKEGKHNVFRVLTIVAVGSLSVVFAYKHGDLINMLSVVNRLTDALSGDYVTNSSSLRIIKGLTIFKNLPVGFKIFGIGFGTYTFALQNSIISTNVAMVENEYMNSFSYILVSSGIIGGTILLSTFTRLFKKAPYIGRMMIIALFIMALGSSIYSSPICIWIMLVILNSITRDTRLSKRKS